MDVELTQAIQLAQQGRRTEATYQLRRLLQRDPYVLEAWRWLAYCTSDRDEAVGALRYVLQNDPNDAWARQMWASIHSMPSVQQVQHIQQSAAAASVHKTTSANRGGILPLWLTVFAMLVAAIVIVSGSGLRLWQAITASANDSRPGTFPIIEQTETTPPPTVQPGSQVVVNEQIDYYTFEASNQSQIQEQLYENSPNIVNGEHAIAVTSYEFQVSWDWRQEKNACVVEDVTVNLDLVYTYPEWKPTGSPVPSLVEEWGRFIRHVTAHEENHGQIAIGCANEIADKINQLETVGSCQTLEGEMNAVIDGVYESCSARQQAYDDAEGRTSFPLP